MGKNVELTSLMGPDKRTFLEKLPQYFEEILHPETCGEIKWLREEFRALYENLSSWQPNIQHLEQLEMRTKLWVSRRCCLGNRRIG